MNRITIATSLALALTACTDEANIGVDIQPVTCAQVGSAEVTGQIHTPATTDRPASSVEFGTTTPRVQLGTAGADLSLTGREIQLNIGFRCGDAQLDSYDVVELGRNGLDCPLQVTGSLSGQQFQYIGAQSGTLIVDENSNCLAGRFSIDFGNSGSLTGWFSSAWQ